MPSTVSFVVASSGGFSQVAPQFALLRSVLREGSELVLLAAEDCSAYARELADLGVRCMQFPGASVFELRARIPAICRKDWICLVEDHAILDRGAVGALYGLIEARPDVDAVGFLGKNLTSLSPWDWANFLHTFSFAWAPVTQLPRKLAATNLAVRRARLRTDARLDEGEWELRLIPGIHASGKVAWSNDIFVDHVKHLGVRDTLVLNYHNGRACAGLTGTGDQPVRTALREAWHGYTDHQRHVGAEIAGRKRDLPAHTDWRLRAIGLAHFLGALAGGCLGAGKSARRVD